MASQTAAFGTRQLPRSREFHFAFIAWNFCLPSRGIRRERRILLLGAIRAEQRPAAFLLDLSERCLARGYSALELLLRMTRLESGSYLGLKLETVSRLLARFAQQGFIQAEGRGIKQLDRVTLRRLLEQ